MFNAIIKFLKDILSVPTMMQQLEAHIISGNPQNAADVEQLERGFYNKYQRDAAWYFRE